MAQAERLADQAAELYERGDYPGAIQKMLDAVKLERLPTFVAFLAEAHEKLGKLVEAKKLYEEVVETKLPDTASRAWRDAQRSAEKQLRMLSPRIPQLTLTIKGGFTPTLSVLLDGKPFPTAHLGQPVPVDPGKHTLVVKAPGRPDLVREVVLKERKSESHQVELPSRSPTLEEPAEQPPPKPPVAKRTVSAAPNGVTIAGYVALGVGGAGLVVGAIAGGLAVARRDEAREQCGPRYDEGECPNSQTGPLHDARTTAGVSTAGFVIAGVGAAAGTLLLLWPKKEPLPVEVTMSPGFLTVRGAF